MNFIYYYVFITCQLVSFHSKKLIEKYLIFVIDLPYKLKNI